MLSLEAVIVGSEDPKQLADFYTKVLGAPNPDWSDEDNGWFAFQTGHAGLVVGPHSEVRGRNEQPGRILVNFSTSDVNGEFERIRSLGAEVVAEPYEPGMGAGMLLCTFADPDGNYIQLATPWSPEST